ncbi:hypothetical protein Tco_0328217 [Tanacetum coccineum]
MVAFLKKPEGSEGFHQIVYFLNSTYIKYALTKNPTIYVSLIHQFWQTTSISTSENGEIEITAIIDRRVKTVTEASIRRHLMLEDSDGISTFPLNGEVYTAEPDISTANVPVNTAGAEVSTVSPKVKTAAESLVYIRRSATKRKDKGKAIMKESEPVQEKTKLQLEQERLGYEEALRLQEQLDEEERQRIAIVHEEANTFNIKELFETTIKRVKDFVPMESDRLVPKISTGSSKRTAETELDHEGSKRQKTNEEQSAEEEKELSEEELQKLMMIVPVEEIYVEALQVKYLIIDWEVYSKDTRKY